MTAVRSRSIRRKLTVSHMVSSTAALVLACGVFVMWEYWSHRSILGNTIATQADIVGANAASAILFGDAKSATGTLAALRAEPAVERAFIQDSSGAVFARYVRDGAGKAEDPLASASAGVVFLPSRMILTKKIEVADEVVGRITVYTSLESLRERLLEHLSITAIVLFFACLTALFISRRLQRAISEPILELAGIAQSISRSKDYSIRAKHQSDDELGILGEHFNAMLDEMSRHTHELMLLNRELGLANHVAEGATRLKSQFLANMSHEIRTPMNGILGITELVLGTELTTDQRELLSAVKSSGESLLTVINDILDFSKIEAGKLVLNPAPFQIRDVLAEIARTMAIPAEIKDLELILRVAPDVPSCVIGDQNRLRQVLLNLLGNAIKFTSHGEVSVSVAAGAGAAHGIQFEVRDTGIGIPVAQQQYVFEAFAQSDGSLTREHGGTGLGLAISSQLVQLMGGRLDVESAQGAGSTFRFSVEMAAPAGLPALGPEPEPALRGVPILVVEHNRTSREMVAEIIESLEACPVLADSTAAASILLDRASAAGAPFPVLLLDGRLPARAAAFVSVARNHPGLNGEIVVMLRTMDLPREADRFRSLQVRHHLTRPVLFKQLLETLQIILQPDAVRPRTRAGLEADLQPHARVSLRVLVAEDNPTNQLLVSRALSKLGHRPQTAVNGQEAIDLWAREEFDLILMDVQMPGMGGIEATHIIRKREKQSGMHIPIIALTAHALANFRDECLEKGMDGYLTKPLRFAELNAALAGVSPRSSYSSAL